MSEARVPQTRIESYSTFVRRITDPCVGNNPLWDLRQLPDFPRCPVHFKLRHLEVALANDQALENAQRLLGPSLESFHLLISGLSPFTFSSAVFSTFVQALPSSIPNVRRLTLALQYLDEELVKHEVGEALAKLSEVRTMSLDYARPCDLLSSLAKMNLTELTMLDTTRRSEFPSEEPSQALSSFHSLKALHLNSTTIFCTELLGHMELPQLFSLELDLQHFEENEIECLCKTIARHSRSLDQLYIASKASREDLGGTLSSGRFPTRHFSPLFACWRLERVSIIGGMDGHDVMLWAANDVLQMARSWSHISVLVLLPRADITCTVELEPSLGIYDLLPLALHCHGLSLLAIAINASVPSAPLDDVIPASAMKTLLFQQHAGQTCSSVSPALPIIEQLWPNAGVAFWCPTPRCPSSNMVWAGGPGVYQLIERRNASRSRAIVPPSRNENEMCMPGSRHPLEGVKVPNLPARPEGGHYVWFSVVPQGEFVVGMVWSIYAELKIVDDEKGFRAFTGKDPWRHPTKRHNRRIILYRT